MSSPNIYYKAGYKYQLAETYSGIVSIRPPAAIDTGFLRLDPDGLLTIKKGYAWDGPSGPAIDTPNFMRGSLVHDALYQLMRSGLLAHSNRAAADAELRRVCVEDGMSRFRAWYVFKMVGLFADPASRASHEAKIQAAP